MKLYRVHLKGKTSQDIRAYGYSESGIKIFFHKEEDKKDYDSYFLKSEVVGIDCLGDADDYDSPIGVFES